MDTLLKDFRYAVRTLLNHPGSTMLAKLHTGAKSNKSGSTRGASIRVNGLCGAGLRQESEIMVGSGHQYRER